MNSKLLVTVLSALVFAGARLQAAGDDTVLLNTLGYTTGQSVLLTHMAVGTLADAYVAKTYKSDQASTFINTYINVTKGMKEQMTKLVDADTLSKNDAQFVKNTIDVLDLVVKESEELKAYIITGDAKEAQAYDKARQKALKEIKTLLGMKD
jgi:CHASE3 domain sensor protein